jgi:hypothetical protein
MMSGSAVEVLGKAGICPAAALADLLDHAGLEPAARSAVGALVTAAAVHAPGREGSASDPEELIPSERRWTDQQVVDTVTAAQAVQGWAEHLSLLAARVLTARAGAELLARAEVSSVEEFASPSRRERWRREAKSVTAAELAAATGWHNRSCHERVAVATAPAAATDYPMQQLSKGEVTWRHVASWHRRTHELPPGVAGHIAATCMDPLKAMGNAAQRLDPDTGEVVDTKLSWAQFERVLEREAVRAEGGDDRAARERRRRDLARRDVRTQMFDFGTGSMTITGDGPALAAAAARIDRAARRLRKAGDERTLASCGPTLPSPSSVSGSSPTPRNRSPRQRRSRQRSHGAAGQRLVHRARRVRPCCSSRTLPSARGRRIRSVTPSGTSSTWPRSSPASRMPTSSW